MTVNEYKTWLAGLKVGDKVAVHLISSHTNRENYQIRTIEKINKNKIWIDGYRYFTNGKISTSENYSTIIEPITDKIRDDLEYKELLIWIMGISKYDLTLDQLRKIKEIAEEIYQDDNNITKNK